MAGLAGCIVVKPPHTHERPRWYVKNQTVDVGCVSGVANIRKSGKQGIGMSVQLKSRSDCVVAF